MLSQCVCPYALWLIARGPAAAARHSQSARVRTDFPKLHLFSNFSPLMSAVFCGQVLASMEPATPSTQITPIQRLPGDSALVYVFTNTAVTRGGSEVFLSFIHWF